MLWEYVYIGSDMLRTAFIGLCLAWPTTTVTAKTQQPPGLPNNRKHRRRKSSLFKKKTKSRRPVGSKTEKGLGILFPLEPRILFDGAALVTGAEIMQDQSTQDLAVEDQTLQESDLGAEPVSNPFTDRIDLISALSSLSVPSDRREIIFIDTNVENYQTLLYEIEPHSEAVLLDPMRDGIEQIAEILGERTDIDAVHIISHGDSGELRLGTGVLDLASMQEEYADELATINGALTEKADILIYGCNFGRGALGQEAASLLAKLTGADIAASNDLTGTATLSGDWELEVKTGTIESTVIITEKAQDDWTGLLATFNVTNTNDSGAGSLRQAIIDANTIGGQDTINIPLGLYNLTSGELAITDDVIITGAGAQATIIDGGGSDRVFHTVGTITVDMSGVTIQGGNQSNGGGIFVDNSSILNLSDAALIGNTNSGTGNAGSGGAIHVHGTANLNRVLLTSNTANSGGGIGFHGGSGSLINVTISGNTSTTDGGGLWADSSVTVTNSTFTLNHANSDGGGIWSNGGTITISNTIVSDNTAGNSNPDVEGNFTSNGFNLIENVGAASGFGGDITGVSANLDTLGYNGGPTQTHALLTGSLALDNGTTTGAPTIDQRGILRDANPDIGAFEVTTSQLAITGEFMVNDPSPNNEVTSGPTRGAERAVDMAPNGDYVVVWTDETASNQIYAKVFDKDGTQKVAQFQVNTGGGNNSWADVAMDASGNFVVAWTQANDVTMRRYLADGTAVDPADVVVNTTGSDVQQNPSIRMNDSGDFIIAWEGNGASSEGIFVRQGSFVGGLIGTDITVDTTAAAHDPSVGIADSGDFVVVWDDGAGDVRFQQYNSAGVPQNSGQVDGLLQLSAGGAAVDMSGDGRFTVVYRNTLLDIGVYARQFDAAGNPLSSEILVNTSTSGDQTNPSITMDDTGAFIVVWEGAGVQPANVDADGVFGQKFDASGTKIGGEFLINQSTANVQDRASVASVDGDSFVVVWTGNDGTQNDIFARQMSHNDPPQLYRPRQYPHLYRRRSGGRP